MILGMCARWGRLRRSRPRSAQRTDRVMAARDPGLGQGRFWKSGRAGEAGRWVWQGWRGDRVEEAEIAGAWREKERKEMTGGVAVSVGGERDAALRNVADGWARLVSGRRGKQRSGERRVRGGGTVLLGRSEREVGRARGKEGEGLGQLAGWAGFWFPHLLQTQHKSNSNSNKI